MTALGPFLRRFLAIAFLVGVVAGVWLLLVQPVSDRFESHRESIARSQELLVGYLRIGGAREQLQRQLDAARRSREGMGGFLKGASAELVGAEVQRKVREITDARGGELKTIQILPAEAEDRFSKVTVKVMMIADAESLQKIFYALEAAMPFLFLDNLLIRAQYRRSGEMEVRYDVYGYMQVNEP
jgi:general secretion pathway protein M